MAAGEIHLQIEYDIDAGAQLDRRFELEDALVKAAVGEVIDSGSGMGVMDLYLQVADVTRAIELATGIVRKLGLGARTTITDAALDDDSDV